MNDIVKKARWVSRITTWTLRILLALTIVFFLGVFIAAMLSGNGPMQKSSLEKVFGGFFGQVAKIERLNTYEFFPVLRLDFENMILVPDGQEVPVAILGALRYEQDTLSNFVGVAPVLVFDVKNFITAPGFWGPYSLHVKEAHIEPRDDGVGVFHVMGDYGGTVLDFQVPMSHGPKYQMDGTKKIAVVIGKDRGFLSLTKAVDDRLVLSFSFLGEKTSDVIAIGELRIQIHSFDQTQSQAVDFFIEDPRTGLRFSGGVTAFSKQVQIKGTWGGDLVHVQDGAVTTIEFMDLMRRLSKALTEGEAVDATGKKMPFPHVKLESDIHVSEVVLCPGAEGVRNVQGRLILSEQSHFPVEAKLTAQRGEMPLDIFLRFDRTSPPMLTQKGSHAQYNTDVASCSH